MPAGDICSSSGFRANTMIHPITRYSAVLAPLNRPVKKPWNTSPAAAMPHTIPNSVHPSAPRSVISMNGV